MRRPESVPVQTVSRSTNGLDPRQGQSAFVFMKNNERMKEV
jgi:hypothetical protein